MAQRVITDKDRFNATFTANETGDPELVIAIHLDNGTVETFDLDPKLIGTAAERTAVRSYLSKARAAARLKAGLT